MKIKIAVLIESRLPWKNTSMTGTTQTNLYTLFEDLEEFDDFMQLDPNCTL